MVAISVHFSMILSAYIKAMGAYAEGLLVDITLPLRKTALFFDEELIKTYFLNKFVILALLNHFDVFISF